MYDSDSLSGYSDQDIATAYRELREYLDKYRDELIARGYSFEIKSGSGFYPTKPSRSEFHWRKLIAVKPEEIILT